MVGFGKNHVSIVLFGLQTLIIFGFFVVLIGMGAHVGLVFLVIFYLVTFVLVIVCMMIVVC